MPEDPTFPFVVHADAADVDPVEWASSRRSWFEERLLDVGAVLLRGFAANTVEVFESFVKEVGGTPLEYRERSSPRSKVQGNIYTSTEYPAAYPIPLHNENSYAASWPMKLFFRCHTPPGEGGETPIAPMRAITRDLDPDVRQMFAERGVLYVRNYRPDMGLDWTTVFATSDKSEVERHCRSVGMEWDWRDEGLRTRHVRPAFQHHPTTGEELWFNHAAFFHVSSLAPPVREGLLAAYSEDELPNNSYFGDGTPIPEPVLDHIRSVYDDHVVAFPWQQDDVLVIDNMLSCHGRSPYSGDRKILVAMGQAHETAAVA